MNHIALIGRLTADPELRQTQSGVDSCRFTVAVNRKYKNEQTGEYDADFITCTAWRSTAQFISRYFTKGKQIALEGNLRTGKYQDKNHPDVTHYTTEVFVENVEFVGTKNESGQAQQPTPAPAPAQNLVNKAQEQGVPSEYVDLLGENDMPF